MITLLVGAPFITQERHESAGLIAATHDLLNLVSPVPLVGNSVPILFAHGVAECRAIRDLCVVCQRAEVKVRLRYGQSVRWLAATVMAKTSMRVHLTKVEFHLLPFRHGATPSRGRARKPGSVKNRA